MKIRLELNDADENACIGYVSEEQLAEEISNLNVEELTDFLDALEMHLAARVQANPEFGYTDTFIGKAADEVRLSAQRLQRKKEKGDK